jgi:hypothetical protein
MTNSSTGLVTGTPATVGTSTLYVWAANSAGTTTLPITFIVSAVGSGVPVITSATTFSATVGQPYSYQITATNNPTSYGGWGGPNGGMTNSSTGLVTGTPAAAGTSTLYVWAANSFGTATIPVTFTASPATGGPAGPPSITSALTASGTMGSSFSYQITATNSPTSYGALVLPVGLSFNTVTGLISGTPTVSGATTVSLSATNSAGTGTAGLALTIGAVAPSITSATSATQPVSSSFSYQITATNSPTSYGATGLPGGVTLNTSSGLIFGTPSSSGTYVVGLTATNSAGTASSTLTLTITHIVTLNWSPSSSQNIAGYNVYRGTTSGGPYTELNSTLVGGTSYTDTAVQPGMTYYYVATSVDFSGNQSEYSSPASATVPSP